MTRTILHVDMDAFFASVEQARRPALRGKPIVVAGAGDRTVILTASYEARAYGIRTGMTIPEAFRRCPSLIRVPADNRAYAEACNQIVEILRKYTPEIQVYSIDEAFLDLTASLSLFRGAEAIAREIKTSVLGKLGITCSIGIAPNKLLAKLASGLVKPNGLTVLIPPIIPYLLEETPVEALCGIGEKTTLRLNRIGIRTCGELGRASISLLRSIFGIWGEHLAAMGRGEDPGEVIPEEIAPDPKSIGHSMTLERDIDDRALIEIYLLQLSEKVGRRLRRGGWVGRMVTLTLRDRDFSTHTHRRRLAAPAWESLKIFQEIKTILLDVPLRQPVRLVGVSAGDLVKWEAQPSLFTEIDRRKRLYKSIDDVNDRMGEFTLTWGSLIERQRHRGVISPSWRPDGIRRYL